MPSFSTALLVSDTIKATISFGQLAFGTCGRRFGSSVPAARLRWLSVFFAVLGIPFFIGSNEPSSFGWQAHLILAGTAYTLASLPIAYVTILVSNAAYSAANLDSQAPPHSQKIISAGTITVMTLQVISVITTLVTDSLYWNSLRYFSLCVLILCCGAFFLPRLLSLSRMVRETVQGKPTPSTKNTEMLTIGYSSDKTPALSPAPLAASIEMSPRRPIQGKVQPSSNVKIQPSPSVKIEVRQQVQDAKQFEGQEGNREHGSTNQQPAINASMSGLCRTAAKKKQDYRERLVRKFNRLFAIGTVLYAAGLVLIFVAGLSQILLARQNSPSYAENYRSRSVSYRPVNDLASYLALLCNSALQYYARTA